MALKISDLGITLQFIIMPEDKYHVYNMRLSGKDTTIKKKKEGTWLVRRMPNELTELII